MNKKMMLIMILVGMSIICLQAMDPQVPMTVWVPPLPEDDPNRLIDYSVEENGFDIEEFIRRGGHTILAEFVCKQWILFRYYPASSW